jgi:dolichyl-phosphate beta-glucosyltransferase
LSVVVPAYNEEGRIGASLRKIAEHLTARRLGFEIIVVDDGSTDGTSEAAGRIGGEGAPVRIIRNPANKGKGAAVRTGIAAAAGDVVLFSDADLSTPIEEIDNLLPWLDSHDLVIASRSLRDSRVEVRQPRYRELMGRMFNVAAQILLVRGLIDTQCGFKLMTRKAVDRILPRLRIDSFSFDVEMIVAARRGGLAVKEVPVRWVNSRASRVSPIYHSAQMLLDLFRIKFYDISGVYGKSD